MQYRCSSGGSSSGSCSSSSIARVGSAAELKIRLVALLLLGLLGNGRRQTDEASPPAPYTPEADINKHNPRVNLVVR